MDFYAVLDQVLALLRQQVASRTERSSANLPWMMPPWRT
jgi:hypothetical protein